MKSLRNDERGIVSIVVTVVFILLMSMIVLAMSQNSNREQRQALDRQLSDQAFYNAESGIADWANYLYKNPNAPAEKTDCSTDGSFSGAPQGSVDNDVNSYSCVTYDRAPNSIEINPLNADKAKVFRIRPQGSGATDTITRLNLNWTSPTGANNIITGCPLPTISTPPATISSGTCNLTGIRFEIFEVKNTRDELINSNFVGYLLPSNSGAAATIGYSPGQQGFVRSAGCTTAGGCSVGVNGLSISNASEFYLVIKSLYTTNKLTITAQNGSGSQLDLVDAQVMIDSTGRANDVLRRVQVRLPAQRVDYQAGTGGSDVLATKESICKLLDVSDVDRTATFAPGC